ncbi:hypothetical protein TNCV_2797212 [Trichonephila clavipes]|nr:hypothetical protein TNCV_2797212 [Trichonephila clavipes]
MGGGETRTESVLFRNKDVFVLEPAMVGYLNHWATADGPTPSGIEASLIAATSLAVAIEDDFQLKDEDNFRTHRTILVDGLLFEEGIPRIEWNGKRDHRI